MNMKNLQILCRLDALCRKLIVEITCLRAQARFLSCLSLSAHDFSTHAVQQHRSVECNPTFLRPQQAGMGPRSLGSGERGLSAISAERERQGAAAELVDRSARPPSTPNPDGLLRPPSRELPLSSPPSFRGPFSRGGASPMSASDSDFSPAGSATPVPARKPVADALWEALDAGSGPFSRGPEHSLLKPVLEQQDASTRLHSSPQHPATPPM